MKTTHVKRFAVAGAISGALGLAALGFGAGTASADESATPFMPANPSDWQSYIPLAQSLGNVVNGANLNDLGSGGNLGALENLAAANDLGSLGNLGGLGSLGSLDRGQLENLLAAYG